MTRAVSVTKGDGVSPESVDDRVAVLREVSVLVADFASSDGECEMVSVKVMLDVVVLLIVRVPVISSVLVLLLLPTVFDEETVSVIVGDW